MDHEEDLVSGVTEAAASAASGASVEGDTPRRRRGRHATVYDAVSGKITTLRLRSDEGDSTRPGKRKGQQQRIIKHPLKDRPLGPDEVLFQRKDAPQRYAEHDIYFSHERDLPRAGRGVLPESDLLKAIHAYASHYYGAMAASNGRWKAKSNNGSAEETAPELNVDERSMDETALLAFGILLEEAGREALGRRGDLVFTEPASNSVVEASRSGAADFHKGDDRNDDKDDTLGDRPRVVVGQHVVGPRGMPERRKRRRVSVTPGRDNASSPT